VVLPVADVNPTRRRPVVTVLLVAANVLVFVALQPRGGCAEAAFLYRWAAVPVELLRFSPLTVGELGGSIGEACAARVGDKSVLLSALSAMFLHANWAHLGGNVLYLWVFGNNVEDRLGHLRFLAFYAVGGATATYVFALANPAATGPLLGASGAIAAVLGAYLVLYPRAAIVAWVPFPLYLLTPIVPGARMRSWFLIAALVTLPAWLTLGLWFVLQLLASSSPAADGGVAYVAHAAGFVAGIVLLLALDRRRRQRGREPVHRSRRDGPYTVYRD
jgi:membrane associated rhomboid family serine protease